MPSSAAKRRILSDSIQPTIDSFFRPPNSSIPNPSSLSSPPLPYSLQSDLMHVGMRVRKAVSEGYKTTDCYYSKIGNNHNGLYGTWTNTVSGKNEKENNQHRENADEGYASLPSGQQSKVSSNAIKRGHEEDEVENVWELRKATPSPPININNYSQTTIHKAFALPRSQMAKSRKRAFHAAVSRQELTTAVAPVPAEDFEEAVFLKPVGDVMDVE